MPPLIETLGPGRPCFARCGNSVDHLVGLPSLIGSSSARHDLTEPSCTRLDIDQIAEGLMPEDDGPDAGGNAVKTVTWTDNASWDEVLRQAGQEDVLVLR